MAEKKVNPKMKNSNGTYDNLVFQKAQYAMYASEDTSKGTIEERLNRLAERQYSITDTSGNVLGTIRRQGNFAIGTIDLSKKSGDITPIDRNFAPISTISFGCDGKLYVYATGQFSSTVKETGGSLPYVTFSSGGSITTSTGSEVSKSVSAGAYYGYASANATSLSVCKFGYEVRPFSDEIYNQLAIETYFSLGSYSFSSLSYYYVKETSKTFEDWINDGEYAYINLEGYVALKSANGESYMYLYSDSAHSVKVSVKDTIDISKRYYMIQSV